MSDREKNDPLDELLDSALAQYSSAEPRPGLETRILAHVRHAGATTPSPGRNWRWLWAGAMAAAALVTLVLLAGRHSRVPMPGNKVVQVPPAPVQVSPSHQSGAPAIVTHVPKHGRKMAVSPYFETARLIREQRPSVFPTPTPLSEQEKLALAYAAHASKDELMAHIKVPDAEDEEFWASQPQIISVPQRRTTR
jgi:hypothetical protein